MKEFIREIKPHISLYRDSNTGIAWIADGTTGLGVSVHANISSSGSVAGMRDRGYWGREDRVERSHGFAYNIDSFVCDPNNELELIVASECMCAGCQERRTKDVSLEDKLSDATTRSEAPHEESAKEQTERELG